MSEEILKRWDVWRKYIAGGGDASWPRDEFENIIAKLQAENRELKQKLHNEICKRVELKQSRDELLEALIFAKIQRNTTTFDDVIQKAEEQREKETK